MDWIFFSKPYSSLIFSELKYSHFTKWLIDSGVLVALGNPGILNNDMLFGAVIR
jgi:hypothetical protein